MRLFNVMECEAYVTLFALNDLVTFRNVQFVHFIKFVIFRLATFWKSCKKPNRNSPWSWWSSTDPVTVSETPKTDSAEAIPARSAATRPDTTSLTPSIATGTAATTTTGDTPSIGTNKNCHSDSFRKQNKNRTLMHFCQIKFYCDIWQNKNWSLVRFELISSRVSNVLGHCRGFVSSY